MSELMESRVRSRSRLLRDVSVFQAPSSQSDAKSFHTTISEDRTDQEALEAHRLVALQEKSESDTPSGPSIVSVSAEDSIAIQGRSDKISAAALGAAAIAALAERDAKKKVQSSSSKLVYKSNQLIVWEILV